MKTYEYRHVVCFDDTSSVGTAYYARHLNWQGRCRELFFIREHAPDVLEALRGDLVLVTTRCSCEYYLELAPFDQVVVRMSLSEQVQNRVTMQFDYFRETTEGDELVARGQQQIAAMRRTDEGLVPTPIPESLRAALARYSE